MLLLCRWAEIGSVYRSSSMMENSADVNDVTLQLSDLRKTLESRTTELDAEKEAVMKLQRYVTASVPTWFLRELHRG